MQVSVHGHTLSGAAGHLLGSLTNHSSITFFDGFSPRSKILTEQTERTEQSATTRSPAVPSSTERTEHDGTDRPEVRPSTARRRPKGAASGGYFVPNLNVLRDPPLVELQ